MENEDSFSTVCPYCKKKDELYIHEGKFYTSGLRLQTDGFDLNSAKTVSTEDEWVECHACHQEFALSEVTL